jgi:hypothetical protein
MKNQYTTRNLKEALRSGPFAWPGRESNVDRAIEYAVRRKQETGRSYIVTDFGHSAMDCKENRKAYEPHAIVFKS